MPQPFNNDASAYQVLMVDANGAPLITSAPANADAQTAATVGQLVNARSYGYNGTTWDRLRTKGTGGYQGVSLVRSSDGLEVSIVGDADGVSQTTSLHAHARNYTYNGATWDRLRGNTDWFTLLASAARTAATSSPVQTNHNAKGALLELDITANPGGTDVLYIGLYFAGVSSGSAAAITFTTPAATNGKFYLAVYPGMPAATSFAATATGQFKTGVVPRNWYGVVGHTPAGSSWTYALSACYLA